MDHRPSRGQVFVVGLLIALNVVVFGSLGFMLYRHASIGNDRLSVALTVSPRPVRTARPTFTPWVTLPSATRSQAAVASATPSRTASATSSRTASATPSRTARATPSRTASATPSRTASATSSRTASATPSRTASATPSRTASAMPPRTASVIPTRTANVAPPPPTYTVPEPRKLSVTIAPNRVDIAWQSPIEGRDVRYRVYTDLGMGNGLFTLQAIVQSPRYIDLGLQPATTYRYRVTTWQGGHESEAIRLVATTPSWLRPWLRPSAPLAPFLTTTPLGPPAVEAAVPTPESTPESIVLDLSQGKDFTDDLGVLHIVGELHNRTARHVGMIQIAATLYGRAGEVLGQIEGEALLTSIPPGDAVPFHLTHPAIDSLWNYSLRATGRDLRSPIRSAVAVLHDRTFKDERGFYHVVGQVVNQGDRLVDYARVVVTLYDAWGVVVNNGFVYTDPRSLAPHEKASFDAYFVYFPQVETYRVQIRGP